MTKGSGGTALDRTATGTEYTANIGKPAMAGRRITTTQKSTATATRPTPRAVTNRSAAWSGAGNECVRIAVGASLMRAAKCVRVPGLGTTARISSPLGNNQATAVTSASTITSGRVHVGARSMRAAMAATTAATTTTRQWNNHVQRA